MVNWLVFILLRLNLVFLFSSACCRVSKILSRSIRKEFGWSLSRVFKQKYLVLNLWSRFCMILLGDRLRRGLVKIKPFIKDEFY